MKPALIWFGVVIRPYGIIPVPSCIVKLAREFMGINRNFRESEPTRVDFKGDISIFGAIDAKNGKKISIYRSISLQPLFPTFSQILCENSPN